MIQGSASQYAGRGRQAQVGWAYLNPSIASSSMLFREINRDSSKFTDFIVASSNLVTDISQRSSDLSGLVQNLATTTEALAAQRTALGESIQRLPGFMRLANTTFVNLRRALDDLTPLVDVSQAGRSQARAAAGAADGRWSRTPSRPFATCPRSCTGPGRTTT